MLLKKLNKHCLEPFFTCLGGHDTVRSHELRLGSNNYTARFYSLVPHLETKEEPNFVNTSCTKKNCIDCLNKGDGK